MLFWLKLSSFFLSAYRSKENVPAAEGAPTETTEGEGETESAEEENKTMTLDEYKAQLEKERFKSDVRVRKAGENEDMSRWKNTRVLKKNPADDDDDLEYVVSYLLLFSVFLFF